MHTADDRVNVNLDLPQDKKVLITWDRKVGLESKVRVGNTLGVYDEVGNPDAIKVKIKAPISGKVIFFEQAGTEVGPTRVCVMEKCKHDVLVGKLCTFCGLQVNNSSHDSVGFVHKDFAVSHEKAQELYEDLEVKVLSAKKLFLVLDLDNTLIHAELLKRGPEKVELAFKVEEEGLEVLDFYRDSFVVKLRPFLQDFLANLSLKYQIHVYTKGTRDYAERILKQVDPASIYVSLDRLISRNEMGENEYKSIKKVIHDGSLALILDDRSDVWGNIKNLVYTQPFHYFENIEGKLTITRKADVFLYMTRDVLEFIHEIFYSFHEKGKRIKIYEIYHTIRQSLFARERVAFFGLFQNEQELKKSREYKSLKKLGAASISLEPSKETTLIFSRYSSKIKAYPVTDIPVVSLWYIYYCEMYCTHLNPEDFDLRLRADLIINLEKSVQKSMNEKNAAKDQIEDYLMNNESNKGGLNYIKETVIRKLEAKLEGKGRDQDENKDDADDDNETYEKEPSKKFKGNDDDARHNLIESEKDHPLDSLGKEGQDNQEIIDKEVNLVHHLVE